jgi:hypothetical protein
LNSRLNLRLCMAHLRLNETPNLGVHQTGSSSNKSKYGRARRSCRVVSGREVCWQIGTEEIEHA